MEGSAVFSLAPGMELSLLKPTVGRFTTLLQSDHFTDKHMGALGPAHICAAGPDQPLLKM